MLGVDLNLLTFSGVAAVLQHRCCGSLAGACSPPTKTLFRPDLVLATCVNLNRHHLG